MSCLHYLILHDFARAPFVVLDFPLIRRFNLKPLPLVITFLYLQSHEFFSLSLSITPSPSLPPSHAAPLPSTAAWLDAIYIDAPTHSRLTFHCRYVPGPGVDAVALRLSSPKC